MVLSKWTESVEDVNEWGINRRDFLSRIGAGALAWTALISSSTSALAGALLDTNDVESILSKGLDNPENMRIFRAMIKAEVAEAYKNNPQAWYPSYNSDRIDNDQVFFWNVRRNVSNQIEYDRITKTHYDNRIKGKIDFSSPDAILEKMSNRVPSMEQEWNIAFIMKDQNRVDVFIYYEAWILKYVFPTTIWSGSDTPSIMVVGWSEASGDKRLANYWKIDGKRWPMPYSRRLSTLSSDLSERYEGINTHIWNVWPWKSSHGCARQWALAAAILYHTMKDWTIVYRTAQKLDPET